MKEIVKSLLEKIEFRELSLIAFVVSLLLKLLPDNTIEQLGLSQFVLAYQPYISLILLCCGSHLLFNFIRWSFNKINDVKVKSGYLCKKYLESNQLQKDELLFLIEVFYSPSENRFKLNGEVYPSDGRKANLENNGIIYLASNHTKLGKLSYNLHPSAITYLNKLDIDGMICWL